MTTPSDTATTELGPSAHSCRQAAALRATSELVRPSPVARERDDVTAALLEQLSAERYTATHAEIAAPITRHSASPEFRIVLPKVAEVLSDLGCRITRTTFAIPGGHSENCIAEYPGTGDDRGLVVISAHLDSVNRRGADLPAPGADDNASGSAGVLELARVLTSQTWRNDVRFILFGGEEQGLFGSIDYVNELADTERDRLTAVINMDMIARRNTAEPGVLIEGAPASQTLIDELATSAATWTELTVTTSTNPFASDHVPFIDAGLPAVLTIEADDDTNTDVHTENDVLTKVDVGLAMAILRMNLAVAAAHLRRPREV